MQQYLASHSIGNRQLMPLIFIVLALPATLLFTFLTPPFQVPDAMEHYYYARSISLGQFLPEQIEGAQVGAGGPITITDRQLVGIFRSIPFKPKVKVTSEMLENARKLARGQTVVQNYWGSAIYPPTAYVVPGAALFISDHFGLNPLSSYYSGRVANALVYVLVGALAIWLTPVAKFGFALILLLPMSLSQAGSYSADANVFALSALVCGLLAREAGREHLSIFGIVLVALLLIPLAAAKAPLIALVIPLTAVAWRRSRTLAAFVGILLLLAFALWTVEFVLTDAQNARLATLHNGSNAKQATFLLSSPFSVIPIAIHTIKANWLIYFKGMTGIFGWLDTPLNGWFYLFTFICISVTFLKTLTEPSLRLGLPFLIASVLATALTFGALYLSWTPVGGPIVEGVQGRYFIPILFPLFLSVAGAIRCANVPDALGLVPVILLWTVSSVYVPIALVERFYLS